MTISAKSIAFSRKSHAERAKVSRDSFRMEVIPDGDADTSYLEQNDFEDRLAEYRAGSFELCGVRAVVDIELAIGGGTSITQRIASPGLWGIEDDSGADYLKEVYADECEVLATMLSVMGMTIA